MSNTNSTSKPPRTDNAYLAQQGYKPGAPIRRITLNATGIKVDPALPLVISSNGAGGVRYAMGEQQNQTAIDEATLFTQDRAQSTPANLSASAYSDAEFVLFAREDNLADAIYYGREVYSTLMTMRMRCIDDETQALKRKLAELETTRQSVMEQHELIGFTVE